MYTIDASIQYQDGIVLENFYVIASNWWFSIQCESDKAPISYGSICNTYLDSKAFNLFTSNITANGTATTKEVWTRQLYYEGSKMHPQNLHSNLKAILRD